MGLGSFVTFSELDWKKILNKNKIKHKNQEITATNIKKINSKQKIPTELKNPKIKNQLEIEKMNKASFKKNSNGRFSRCIKYRIYYFRITARAHRE